MVLPASNIVLQNREGGHNYLNSAAKRRLAGDMVKHILSLPVEFHKLRWTGVVRLDVESGGQIATPKITKSWGLDGSTITLLGTLRAEDRRRCSHNWQSMLLDWISGVACIALAKRKREGPRAHCF